MRFDSAPKVSVSRSDSRATRSACLSDQFWTTSASKRDGLRLIDAVSSIARSQSLLDDDRAGRAKTSGKRWSLVVVFIVSVWRPLARSFLISSLGDHSKEPQIRLNQFRGNPLDFVKVISSMSPQFLLK